MPIVVTSSVPQTPSADSESSDGRIRATVMPEAAGVFVRVDFSDALPLIGYTWPNPFRVTIFRETPDGVTTAVRGADSIAQYGGIFHAYDDEVTFGDQVVYWAVAPQADGSDGLMTDKVAVLTWAPDGGFTSPGVWIKNLENPGLSCPARCQDWSTFTFGSRNAVADIWGSPFAAVVTDVRKAATSQMTILTADEDEYQAVLAAMDASIVYIVGLERHRRRTGYYLIGDAGSARVAVNPATGYDTWTVPLQGMGNPGSSGQSLTVPGRSYRDRKAQYATYQAVKDTGRLYGAGTEPYGA